MTTPLVTSALPLPLLRRGKVREVYEIDADTLLLVASDRVSAFDVVLREPVPHKGAVLTQLSAFWFERLASVISSHFLSADADEIVARGPALGDHRAAPTRRAPGPRTVMSPAGASPASTNSRCGTTWRV